MPHDFVEQRILQPRISCTVSHTLLPLDFSLLGKHQSRNLYQHKTRRAEQNYSLTYKESALKMWPSQVDHNRTALFSAGAMALENALANAG